MGILGLSGCGFHIGEKPAPVKPVEMKMASGCDVSVSRTVKAYLEATASDHDVSQMFSCIKSSLVKFSDHFRGDQMNGFTPEEVRSFVARYLLKDHPLSDSFAKAVMELKVALAGGKPDFIAKSEIAKSVELLDELENEALRLRPYMAVYNLNVAMNRKEQGDTLPPTEEALSTLNRVSHGVGHIFRNMQGTYTLSQFKDFFTELRGFLKLSPDPQSSEKWFAFLAAFKNITLGDRGDQLSPEDWSKLVEAGAGWYSLLLRHRLEIEGRDLFYGKNLGVFVASGNEAFDLLQNAVEAQPNNLIEFSTVDKMIQSAADLQFLGHVRPSSLEQATRAVVTKVLGDTQKIPEERTSFGLSRSALAQARAEFYRWADIQTYLDKLYAPENQMRAEAETFGRKAFGTENFAELNPLKQGVEWLKSQEDDNAREFQRIRNDIRPLFREREYKVFLIEKARFEQLNFQNGFHNLSLMNTMRAAVRLIVRGYSEDPRRTTTMEGLTEDEMQNAYVDFQPFGVDLRIMDPRNRNSGRRGFLETKLFMFSSQGINPKPGGLPFVNATVPEHVEYLSFTLSGGILARTIREELATRCPRGGQDVYGEAMYDKACFLKEIRGILTRSLTNMPEMTKFIVRMNDEQWHKFLSSLMDASYIAKPDPNWVERSELATFSAILQYSEAIVARYNADGDDFLSYSELQTAYPVFRGLLGKMAKVAGQTPDEETIRRAFKYIIKYQEIPDPKDLWVKLRVINNDYGFEDWDDARLDRLGVVKIFGAIVKQIMEADHHLGTI